MAKAEDRFWTGPIRTVKRAKSIIRITGWVFLVLGGLALLSHFLGGPDGLVLITAALALAAPAAILLVWKSRVAAGAVLGVSIFLTLGSVAMLLDASNGGLTVGGTALLLWLLLSTLSWRAFRAASAMKELSAQDGIERRVVEAFE